MTPPVALAPGLAPGTPSVPGHAGAAAGATLGGEGFGALVAAALAAVPGAPTQAGVVTPVAAGATAAAETSPEPPAAVEDETEQADDKVDDKADDKADQLLGVVVPVALLAVTPVAVPTAPAAAPTTAAAGAADVAAPRAVPTELTISPATDAPDFPAALGLPSVSEGRTPGDQPDTPQGGESAARPEPVADTTPSAPSAPAVPQAIAPESATGVSTPSSAGAATATGPVARQTFPEVTRLMSRGDGTHRITLHLRPEGLGEVRVVLTLKEGKVDVRMTSSTEARHALTPDLPELHRLLASAGATETSVSVRDAQQPVASSWDGGRSTTASSQDLMGQAGTGQFRHHEDPQQAGTSADHIARDGARDRARASGPNDPATGTRTTGLDVTV